MRRLLLNLGQTHACDCDGTTTPLGVIMDVLGEPAVRIAGATLGGAGLAAIAYVVWRRALGTKLLLALWTRWEPAEVAKHPRRAHLLDLVRRHPGATTNAILQMSGINEGTLLHHLRTLERAQWVKSFVVGRDRVWFEAGSAKPPEAQLALLHAPARRAILDLLAGEPGLTQAELARRLSLSRPTVHHHVRALREAGRLQVRRDGVRARLYAAAV